MYICICIYICVYVYVYIYVYIYTYIMHTYVYMYNSRKGTKARRTRQVTLSANSSHSKRELKSL